MKRTLVLFLISIFNSVMILAQEQDSLMLKFNDLSNKLYKQPINYLRGDKLLLEYEKYFLDTNLESFYHQVSATFFAISGNQLKAKKSYWMSKGKNIDSTKVISTALENFQNVLKYTKGKQIVMINENHAFPEHRVFTTSLLDSLFKQGFRYLALEDLVNQKSANERIHPSESDGLYINEIMYAEMVRQARIIGFTLVAYDNTNTWDISIRDSLSTLELKKVFKNNPNAKIIIHCGSGHIDKSKKVLASYIKSELKINPLTISQTSLHPVKTESALREPKIISGTINEKFFGIKSDIQIVHPNYDYTDRPEYLFANKRNKISIESDFKYSDPIILEVYQQRKLKKTIPYDRFTVDPTTKKIDISIPKGQFKIVFKNSENEILQVMKISR